MLPDRRQGLVEIAECAVKQKDGVSVGERGDGDQQVLRCVGAQGHAGGHQHGQHLGAGRSQGRVLRLHQPGTEEDLEQRPFLHGEVEVGDRSRDQLCGRVGGACDRRGEAASLLPVRALAQRRQQCVATVRRPSTLDELAAAGCAILPLDVTDDASRRTCIGDIVDAHGPVDVLVNNAGYAEMGPVEEVPLESWRRQLETNVLGPVALAQLVLPAMRAARRGRIVNVSSMGGEITFPGGGAYHASKYALEALSDALRVEVAPFGVPVVLVRPGPVASSFDDNAADLTRYMDGPYAGFACALDEAIREQTPQGASPQRVGAVVARAATAARPATRYRVGAMSRALVLGRRIVPDRLWDAAMTRQFRDPGVRQPA